MNKRLFCLLSQKWLWKRGCYTCFMHLVWKITGVSLSSLMLSCHRHKSATHTKSAAAAPSLSRLFHVMSVDVWVLPCNMIWIKIFIEQMRMGAKVLTCSTQRANISRWTWWVRSSMRFSTSFVTCQNKKADFKTNFQIVHKNTKFRKAKK